jgi:caffeoyl-CoA O-methyltransferase
MSVKPQRPAKPKFNPERQEGMKFVPLNARVFRYLTECRSHGYDRVLEALREETVSRWPEYAQMQIGRDQGSFMTMLVAAIGARRAIEVGTFTGYSAICIARGLPGNGQLLCLDVSEEWTEVARRYWAKAGVEQKITLRLGPGIESLRRLERGLRFDFAFIDAHKPEYEDYFELVLPHMRKNGLILFDNMLWGGRLGKKGPIKNPDGRVIDRLNRKLARDRRVESVLLSIGDGVSMCRVVGGR